VVASKTSTTGKADITAADGLLSNTVYTVKLEVTDKSNLKGYANQTLTVGNCPPTAVIAKPAASITCGGTVTLDGSGSKDVDGTIASYAWKLAYGNTTISKTGVTATVSQTADKLVAGATYQVTLTVKDDKSSSGMASGTLTVPLCVNNPPVCTGAYPSVARISTLVSPVMIAAARAARPSAARALPHWVVCGISVLACHMCMQPSADNMP
jgi:hypothetical protein